MPETIKTLEELYVESLRDMYSAETQIIEALPKMIEGTENAELKNGFQMHLEQTKGQVDRLKSIFEDLEEDPEGHHCQAMEGLLAEGAELLETVEEPDVLDAALIGAAQKVEHYEISGYGTARTFARLLGYEDQAQLLQTTLDEEAQTDVKLTEIAETIINEQAAGTSEGAETNDETDADEAETANPPSI